MTKEELIDRLNKLDRYTCRVCDDGDGHIDDWMALDSAGGLVKWPDIEKIIKETNEVKGEK